MAFFCLRTTKKFGTVLCCIPLAPFVLLVSLGIGGWGGYDVYNLSKNSDWSGWAIVAFILACLRLLAGVGGLLAVVLRMSCGTTLLILGYKLLLASSVITFIMSWITWTLQFAGVWAKEEGKKWEPTDSEIKYMIVFTVLMIVFFVASWWILSAIKSLGAVLKFGGNGWEGLNYNEIKEEQKAKQVKDSDP